MPKLLAAMPSADVGIDLAHLNDDLNFLAETLDDFERARIALDNRIRASEENYAVPPHFYALSVKLHELENATIKDLQKILRQHPLGGFVKGTIGLGEKQVARLLAAIGNPADRAMVSQLWQYCGHGDPERSKMRGSNVTVAVDEEGKKITTLPFSPAAKMRTRMIAESCIKQMHSPYRAVYDRERLKWQDRETSDLHKHNHALRVVGKEILKGLWVESRS